MPRDLLSVRRERAAWLLTTVGLPLLIAGLVAAREHLDLTSALLITLAFVLLVAALGGLRPGIVASVASFVLTNFFLTPPLHTLHIRQTDDLVALVVFVAVALAVSALVAHSARRSFEAEQARADAAALAASTAAIITAADPLPGLMAQLRGRFNLEAVSLLRRDGDEWAVAASSGEPVALDPEAGRAMPLDDGDGHVLVLTGAVTDDGLEVLRALVRQMALGLETQRLRAQSATYEALAEANALRTALLQALAHDLRTPLATIKASVTGLLAGDVGFSAGDRISLLDAINDSSDRLDRVIGNLLDMSRLESGAANPSLAPCALEDVVAAAVSGVREHPGGLVVDVSETLPLVVTDAALLERALANLVSNAVVWSPHREPVRIDAELAGQHVCLHVVDRGPGIPRADRGRLFEPFQRRGDRSQDTGAGLGLAIAKGFVEVTGGSIDLEDTPGGGTTISVRLPVAADSKEGVA